MPLDMTEPRPMHTRMFRAQTVDEEARTVEIVWTTGAAVERVRYSCDPYADPIWYIEELDVSDAAIRLDRLNNGAPLLDSHCEWGGIGSTLGVVERAWIEGSEGRALVRFARDEPGEIAFQRVKDGIIRTVSVGYVTHAVERTEAQDGQLPRERAVDWEPYELSLTPIPADFGAQVRSKNTPATFPCAVRRTAQEAPMADTPTAAPAASADTVPATLMSRALDVLASFAPTRRAQDDGARMDDADEERADDTDEERADDADEEREDDADEAERAAAIVETCRQFNALDRAPEFIRSRQPLPAITQNLQEALVSQSDARRAAPSGVTVTRDETETRRDGMIEALAHRAAPGRFAQTDRARDYGRMGLRGLAVELCESSGIRTRGLSNSQIATQALGVRSGLGAMGTTDFAYLTSEVMNRILRAEYAERAPTWAQLSVARSASDFREMHSVRFGGDLSFSAVNESGEYRVATLTDEAEGLQVSKDGVEVRITFEAIVNDDLGAFQRIPGRLSRSARRAESRAVWGLISGNAKLKSDNKTLFHADHKNLIGTGTALSVEALAAGRKLMWEQTDFGGAKDDFIEVEPNLLIVPPAMETEALRFVAQTTPDSDEAVNPYKSTLSVVVEPRLGAVAGGSESAWYLAASDLPPIEHAFLDGYEEGPEILVKDTVNPDGVSMVARHFFGAAPVEYRGMVKNPGA